MERIDPELCLKMATEIVVAYLGKRSVEPDELLQLVLGVRSALIADLDGAPLPTIAASLAVSEALEGRTPEGPQPAVPVAESVTPEFLISLEDGKPYRSLKRHLMARYGMSPDDYRRKWGLPSDYPMVAPDYAKARSEVARRIGLGRAHPAPEPARGRARTGRRAPR